MSRPRSTRKPPQQVYLSWCPVCDRTDRVTDLKERHMTGGFRCPGVPRTLVYKLAESVAVDE